MNLSIIDQQFNSLIITEVRGHDKVSAICKCGVIKEYFLSNIKSGRTKSCGCENRKASSSRFKSYNKARVSRFTPTLSVSHSLSTHPLYYIWASIISRCYNEKDISYCRYGAKGVMVCDEWRSDFLVFYNWALANGWQSDLQIDKDIKGNGKMYSPDSCIFVTRKENCRNRTSSRFIEYNNENKTLAEWCEITGLSHTCIINRLSRGWDLKRTFETPAKNNGHDKS